MARTNIFLQRNNVVVSHPRFIPYEVWVRLDDNGSIVNRKKYTGPQVSAERHFVYAAEAVDRKDILGVKLYKNGQLVAQYGEFEDESKRQ